MDPDLAELLARVMLYVHFLVVAFNIGALVVIPFGKIFDCSFVRVFWWRILHVAAMLLVAAQAALGQYCFLTILEYRFRYESGAHIPPSPFDEWIAATIFWPLPAFAFVPLYLIALSLTVWFWFWVPPRARIRVRQGA